MEKLNISLELNANRIDNSIISICVDDIIIGEIVLTTTDMIKKEFTVDVDSGKHKLRLLVNPTDGNIINIHSIEINKKVFVDTDDPMNNRYLKTHGFYKQPHETEYSNINNIGQPGEFYLPFETPILFWFLNSFPDDAGKEYDEHGEYFENPADYDPNSGLTVLEYIKSVRPWLF